MIGPLIQLWLNTFTLIISVVGIFSNRQFMLDHQWVAFITITVCAAQVPLMVINVTAYVRASRKP